MKFLAALYGSLLDELLPTKMSKNRALGLQKINMNSVFKLM